MHIYEALFSLSSMSTILKTDLESDGSGDRKGLTLIVDASIVEGVTS